MFYLKRCRKCRGDMYLDGDERGADLHCVQCGFTCKVAEVLATARHTARGVAREQVS